MTLLDQVRDVRETSGFSPSGDGRQTLPGRQCTAGNNVDSGRLERGGDMLSLLKQELFEGLSRHVSNQVEAAIHADPLEEAERRDRPNGS